jgi:hypothetical protein
VLPAAAGAVIAVRTFLFLLLHLLANSVSCLPLGLLTHLRRQTGHHPWPVLLLRLPGWWLVSAAVCCCLGRCRAAACGRSSGRLLLLLLLLLALGLQLLLLDQLLQCCGLYVVSLALLAGFAIVYFDCKLCRPWPARWLHHGCPHHA